MSMLPPRKIRGRSCAAGSADGEVITIIGAAGDLAKTLVCGRKTAKAAHKETIKRDPMGSSINAGLLLLARVRDG